ncbi:MAG: adenine phosphoribosyltransferase [Microlunatus sp.]|nr:adenine phosphoribosyltransferase [Microlunatus sp.]
MTDFARLIRDVPDYPQPGVVFRDITPLLASSGGFAAAVDAVVAISPREVDVVVGIEARGFLFGAPVALALGVGFVPIRKPAKLPRQVVSVTYDLEYGSETLALHDDAFAAGARVLVVDDVLATGGTVVAAAELIARLHGRLIGVSLLSELSYLGGRERLEAAGVGPVASVLSFDAP